MNWSRSIWLALAAVLVLPAANAWSPFDVQQELRAMTQPESYLKIDYLVPIADLDNNVRDCLLTYTVHPSFEASARWCLSSRDGRYTLRSWVSGSPDYSGARGDFGDEVAVDIQDEVAEALQEIWINALLEAHYPRFYPRGTDGTLYYFGAKVDKVGLDLHASTWSPDGDLPPAWMVRTGDTILKFCRSDQRNMAALLAQMREQRDRLFRYYRTHRQN
jgi:hypothetical protein